MKTKSYNKELGLKNLTPTETKMLSNLIKQMQKDKEEYRRLSLYYKIIRNFEGLVEHVKMIFCKEQQKKKQAINQLKKLYTSTSTSTSTSDEKKNNNFF